jgi:hypothetical protein
MMQVVKPRWRIGVQTPNFSCKLSSWVLGLKLKTSGACFGANMINFFLRQHKVILRQHQVKFRIIIWSNLVLPHISEHFTSEQFKCCIEDNLVLS